MANDLHDKLVEHLAAMQECCAACEVENGKHDTWVVLRELCRAMWAVLTWILRRDGNGKS